MHEVGIARSILDTVTRNVPAPDRVRAVTVRLGPFSGVSADALGFAFEVLAADSACPRARLCLTLSPAFGDCAACGTDIVLPSPGPTCPRCSQTLLAVRGDDDITLVSVALEEKEVSHA